jgi:hypothetical protein
VAFFIPGACSTSSVQCLVPDTVGLDRAYLTYGNCALAWGAYTVRLPNCSLRAKYSSACVYLS